jgi:hypothetical protein
MAHADSMPHTPGALDDASGVGALLELAPRLARLAPRCDVWLGATGAEERLYTASPDHLGAAALVRQLRALHRRSDLEPALSLDEVGRGRRMELRSPNRCRHEPCDTAAKLTRTTFGRVRRLAERLLAGG